MHAASPASKMLSMALAMTPVSSKAAPPPLVEVGALLDDVGSLINQSVDAAWGTHKHDPVAAIDAVAAEALACGKPARLYLQTGPVLQFMGGGSLGIAITVNPQYPSFQLTFASGTTQLNVIGAINSFSWIIHAEAMSNPADPDRIEIRSTYDGADAFITVQQLTIDDPLVFLEPTGGSPAFLSEAGGEGVSGDLDCDADVDAADLLILLDHWGPDVTAADLNGDEYVSAWDLAMLLAWWSER